MLIYNLHKRSLKASYNFIYHKDMWAYQNYQQK